MITKQDHNTSHTKNNPGIWEMTITIHDRLQSHDKTHPSRFFAGNPDQKYLIFQCLTDLQTETRVKMYPTTKSYQTPMRDITET